MLSNKPVKEYAIVGSTIEATWFGFGVVVVPVWVAFNAVWVTGSWLATAPVAVNGELLIASKLFGVPPGACVAKPT